MGRGRAPCCDKSKVKRGPWSPSEDLKLISFIRRYGHDNWRALPKLAESSEVEGAIDSNNQPEESKWESSLASSFSSYSSPSSPIVGTDPEYKEERNDKTDLAEPKNKLPGSCSQGSDLSNISCEFGGSVKGFQEKADPIKCFVSSEEVNKPDATIECDILKIPFEFDIDFWNMLENLPGPTALKDAGINRILEVDPYRNVHEGGQGMDGGTQNQKWLRYLENELGLVESPAGEDAMMNHNLVTHSLVD
ncbi:hypothetical protein SAY87_021909 [Trapa incisa]|uniref:Uncharacterized protein n=1 Tax=Trapa incisa TaxID=236973 RepID=A0AAN7JSC4_9MYRT|nr:hypothetical protein SAY87_021909 [Trapa incisa]